MRKRGQFTVFVILGFILLVVVLFTLYIVSLIQDANINEQARRAVNDYVDASAINYYIYTCMDKVVNEAVLELAYQGGVFWNETGGFYLLEQPGVSHIPLGVGEFRFNVSYSILGDYGCEKMDFNPTLSLYPFPATKLVDLELKYRNQCPHRGRDIDESGVFGYNNLSRLCNSGSENFRTGGGFFSVCFNDVTSDNILLNASIEDQLQKMLVHKMNNCTNFSIFEEIGDHNITLKNNPSVKIIYGQNDFAVKFNYPFEVKIKNKEPVIVRKDFEYSSRLKIVSLHNYLLNLIIKEVKDPFFNIAEDYKSVFGFNHDNYNLEIIEKDDQKYDFLDCETECLWENDYVLKLEDNSSEATGKYLTFFIAFHNRRPALDWIHETDENVVYDYIVFEGDTILIEPLGIDPENKPVSYSYSGWKETYDTKYNNDPNCNPLTPNTWEKFVECGNMQVIPPVDINKWTTSGPYLISQRNAEYIVKGTDAGLHYTRVSVTDEAQLQDWQDVSILVIDKPTINISINNIVPNVPPNVVSIEDPFWLDSTGTLPSVTPGISISFIEWIITKFADPVTTIVFNLEQQWPPPPGSSVPNVPIPYSEGVIFHPDIWNINLIKPRILDDPINHIITLSVTQTSSIPGLNTIPPFSESRDVQVKECIPFHDGLSNPFPYSGYADPKDENNYRETNHACCSGDINDPNTYELEGTGTSCFSDTWYGEKNKLVEKAGELMMQSFLQEYYDSRETLSQLNIIGNIPTDANDVYRLQFLRKCDGLRGNICAGDGEYSLVMHDSCTNKPPSQEGTCSGPSFNPLSDPLQCIDYPPGITFESLFGTGTGVCETTPACSSSTTYNVPGPFWTMAYCNENGGCTRPASLTCNVANCGVIIHPGVGAECDASNPARRTGTLCEFNCGLGTSCKFSSSNTLPCSGSSCFNSNYNGVSACFSNVQCTSSGSDYTQNYCAVRGTVLNYEGDRHCFWHNSANPPTPPNICSSAGACLIYSMPLSTFGSCPGGQQPTCNAFAGWTCVPI